MKFMSVIILILVQQASGMKNVNGKCPLRSVNATCNKCVQGVRNLSSSLLSLHNNTVHKFDVKKKFEFGDKVLNVYLKQSEETLPPVMYSNEDTLDPNVKPKFHKNYLDLNELSVDCTIKLDQQLSTTSNVVLDLPKTLELTLKGMNGELKNVNVRMDDLIKRTDFVVRYRNLLVGSSYNFRSKEKTLEFMQRFENLYRLYGKNVNVTPKLEVSLDKNNKVSSRACLVLKRDNLTLTPILYPNERKLEVAMEAKVTDEVKVGLFLSKDNNLYLNMSYESFWGSHSWQQFALRFVLSDVLKSYAFVHNEVQF